MIENGDSVLLHGYTSAAGDMKARQTIAQNITKRFGAKAGAENIYITCGAAASLTSSLKAVSKSGDRVVLLAPYFPEYEVFCENAQVEIVSVLGCGKNFSIDNSSCWKSR